tara:strand:+ start:1720 stop:2688 length:969 start_codon:yes stop_codon:yes gene_type:complete
MDDCPQIIGGSGFIGTSISKQYAKDNQEFLVIDKKPPSLSKYKFIKIDITDKTKFLAKRNQGSIINLAAEHRDDVTPKSLYYLTNVDGARNVCEYATLNKCKKIIFTSSVAVYGIENRNVSESDPAKPFNDYGKSKLSAEEVYMNWQKEKPLERTVVLIRPTVVFGEGNRGNVYNLFNFIMNGRFMMIGDGKNVKSIAYVENISKFIRSCVDEKPGVHIYNYVDKPDLTMRELVNTINELKRKKGKIRNIPYFIAFSIGVFFDSLAYMFPIKPIITSIRIKKFCANSQFNTSINNNKFRRDYSLKEAIKKTIRYDFKDKCVN